MNIFYKIIFILLVVFGLFWLLHDDTPTMNKKTTVSGEKYYLDYNKASLSDGGFTLSKEIPKSETVDKEKYWIATFDDLGRMIKYEDVDNGCITGIYTYQYIDRKKIPSKRIQLPASKCEPVVVSFINLIASPERFHKKKISIVGFVNIAPEGTSLTFTKDAAETESVALAITNLSFENQVEVARHNEAVKDWDQQMHNKKVLIEGVFDRDKKGDSGVFAGTICSITRIEAKADINKTSATKKQ